MGCDCGAADKRGSADQHADYVRFEMHGFGMCLLG